MATIININGTSDTTCKCGSWLKHWANFSSQQIPTSCGERNCYESNLVGAHVQKANSTDKNWYIVPLCNKHNASKSDIEIFDSTNLVPANRAETCEKR